jgi:hypothetical protein
MREHAKLRASAISRSFLCEDAINNDKERATEGRSEPFDLGPGFTRTFKCVPP